MKEFIYNAQVVIKAENEDDAQIELIDLMDKHDIFWEKEE